MIGTLYGVGVGPGDKKLLTLQAVETLQNADVIFVPNMGGENTALKIASEYIESKEKIYCELPMTRDKSLLKKSHEECADIICNRLIEGKNGAFITLGDPTVYSTYMYIHEIVLKRGFSAKIINGITSFCAAAAKLNISLCDGEEALHIIPASYKNTKELLKLRGNKVLMKSGKSIGEVVKNLDELNMLDNAKMVECCYMENEKLYTNLREINTDNSYFSVIIVKE